MCATHSEAKELWKSKFEENIDSTKYKENFETSWNEMSSILYNVCIL